MSQAVFPVEIMNEIFRSSELNERALAHCCLLSHRYLEPARKWLYYEVRIGVNQKGTGPQKLILPTARLFDTLRSNSKLGLLIKSICFDNDDFRLSKVECTRRTAVSNLRFAAPNVKACDFGPHSSSSQQEWMEELNRLDVEFKDYQELRNVGIEESTVEFLAPQSNLRRLHLVNAQENMSGSPYAYSNLRFVRIESIERGFDLKAFLKDSSSVLEELHIPFTSLGDLKLGDYPRLHRLELYIDDIGSADLWTVHPDDDDVAGDFFWPPHLRRCTSLSTLAFASDEPLPRNINDRLFGVYGGLAAKIPSSLRRIEFTNQISLDQLSCLFSGETVKELGIVTEELSEWDTMPLEVVRFMRERTGTELIHLPPSASYRAYNSFLQSLAFFRRDTHLDLGETEI